MKADQFQIGELRKLGRRIEAVILAGDKRHEIFFESEDIELTPARETMVALCLYPCMKRGSDLAVNGAISSRVMQNIPLIQDIYHCWDPEEYQRIALADAEAKPMPGVSSRRSALFFSGGMDCWYSLLKNQSAIHDLVFVWGLDIHPENPILFEKTLASLRRIATAFDKRLIVIRTNLRSFTDQYIHWNRMHGTGLAGVAHLLTSEISRINIAAGQSYRTPVPAGSHALVDQNWSSEGLEIIHDGLEKTRLGKVMEVSRSDLALQTLRVCWVNPDNDYNCGRCEKCLRTMVSLQIAGALERCTVFAVPLDLKRLSKLTFFDQVVSIYTRENVEALRQQPHNKRLYRVMQRVLNRFYLYEFLRKVRSNYNRIAPAPARLKKSLRKVRLK